MTKRTPSAVTLRCRAFAKAERLRDRIEEAVEANMKRTAKHSARIKQLETELQKAKDEYDQTGHVEPHQSTTTSTEITAGDHVS